WQLRPPGARWWTYHASNVFLSCSSAVPTSGTSRRDSPSSRTAIGIATTWSRTIAGRTCSSTRGSACSGSRPQTSSNAPTPSLLRRADTSERAATRRSARRLGGRRARGDLKDSAQVEAPAGDDVGGQPEGNRHPSHQEPLDERGRHSRPSVDPEYDQQTRDA